MRPIVFKLCLPALCGAAFAASSPALAAPRPSPAWYVTTPSIRTAFHHGCATGRNHHRGGVLLLFGGPSGTSGTLLVGSNRFMRLFRSVKIAAAFGGGYYSCLAQRYRARHYRIRLIMASNNSTGSNVSHASGRAWGRTVRQAAAAFAGTRVGRHVVVSGGSDLEPGFGPVGLARDWVRGFTGATGRGMYNVGSADGCPQRPVVGDGACNNGWHQSDIWAFSRGIPTTGALPEIYYSANAIQWASISRFGARHRRRGAIRFAGALSEHQANAATLTADQSWSALSQATGQRPSWSAALRAIASW
jgi:hypothetical protein